MIDMSVKFGVLDVQCFVYLEQRKGAELELDG